VRKVPYLGDLPYLGCLFRTTFQECIRRELIIVLTPRIIYCDEDVERVKAEDLSRMEWCLPEVYRVHGDIYAPAYPSVEGGDRCTDVLGQELPANLKLPPVGRPRARANGGPDGQACCNNGTPGEMMTMPDGQTMPTQPGTPAATPATTPGAPNTSPGGL